MFNYFFVVSIMINIFDDNYKGFHIVIKRKRRPKTLSLTNYHLWINNIEIDFYIHDKIFLSMWMSNAIKNNKGEWKTKYSFGYGIPIEISNYAEHIIYEDLYRVHDDLPKVFYNKDYDGFFITRNYWRSFLIEVPILFIQHYPQYAWITK